MMVDQLFMINSGQKSNKTTSNTLIKHGIRLIIHIIATKPSIVNQVKEKQNLFEKFIHSDNDYIQENAYLFLACILSYSETKTMITINDKFITFI